MATITETASGILKEIRCANQNFAQNFSNRDAQGMASLYTSDALLLPPGAVIQKGTNAVQNFWQTVMDMGIKNAHLETLEDEGEGETALK